VETRRLLAFCGLGWNDACLHFEENAAPVATASTVQVREGINARRVGGWQPYARGLEPLRLRLQEEGWL
jgi:hypothetical protein